MALTEAALASRIAAGETQVLELKIKPPQPAELAERICGLANTRSGGQIVFGVDKNRQIVGLATPHEDIDLILWATRLVKPALTLPVPNPVLTTVAGQSLVVLEIPPITGRFIRRGVPSGFARAPIPSQ